MDAFVTNKWRFTVDDSLINSVKVALFVAEKTRMVAKTVQNDILIKVLPGAYIVPKLWPSAGVAREVQGLIDDDVINAVNALDEIENQTSYSEFKACSSKVMIGWNNHYDDPMSSNLTLRSSVVSSATADEIKKFGQPLEPVIT